MRPSRIVAVSLSLLLVLLIGTMHVSIASHGVDHAHHTAATHGSGVCAWMCTGAHSVSPEMPPFSIAPLEIDFLEESHTLLLLNSWAPRFSTRGPPR